MKSLRFVPVVIAFTTALSLWALPAAGASKPSDKEAQKVIKKAVTLIRYKKYDLAAKQVDFNAMSKAIMDDSWGDLSAAQQKEFVSGVETLIRKLSFQKGAEMFEYLDAILYSPVKMDGDKALVKTTVVVHRDVKKTEYVIDFVLTNVSGSWKIMDTMSPPQRASCCVPRSDFAAVVTSPST